MHDQRFKKCKDVFSIAPWELCYMAGTRSRTNWDEHEEAAAGQTSVDMNFDTIQLNYHQDWHLDILVGKYDCVCSLPRL